jgi:hypothetical protein
VNEVGETSDFWAQSVRAAVELKYYHLGDRGTERLRGVRQDVEKLLRYSRQREDHEFLGISLLFIQSQMLDNAEFHAGRLIDSDPLRGIFRFVVTPKEFQRYEA